jgi:hypothetical protein
MRFALAWFRRAEEKSRCVAQSTGHKTSAWSGLAGERPLFVCCVGRAAEVQRYGSGISKRMKRKSLIVILVLVAAVGIFASVNRRLVSTLVFDRYMGRVIESWEKSNQTFTVRVESHTEENAFLPGAYYVFHSAPSGSDTWREIMTFRHDDPHLIPRDQVRFVNDRVGYVFMGWMYAVTADGGASWSIWNAEKDLPKWVCCNYGLIASINLQPDGTGTMILNPIPNRQGEVPQLYTKDFGQHWNL